jgi:hypothetical protein
MARPFNGVINIDTKDSMPDWGPYDLDVPTGGSSSRRLRARGPGHAQPRQADPLHR